MRGTWVARTIRYKTHSQSAGTCVVGWKTPSFSFCQVDMYENMYCRTTLKSMCVSIRGPVMWNKLHSDLKNSTTVNMFKMV